MPIHFHINENIINELTWEEYEAFETAQEGEIKLSKLRPLLARFMVDENNKPLPHAQAMKQLAVIQVAKIKEVVKDFSESMKGAAIPNESGDSLPPPSDQDLVAFESRVGSGS